MTKEKTPAVSADPEAFEPVEAVWLDLSTKEIVRETKSGVARVSPDPAVFDFYVAQKTFPVRNGD